MKTARYATLESFSRPMRLRLFVNDTWPSEIGCPVSMFEELTGFGYKPRILQAKDWKIIKHGEGEWFHASRGYHRFEFSDLPARPPDWPRNRPGPVAFTVFGYFVQDADGGPALWCERFPFAFGLCDSGDVIRIKLNFEGPCRGPEPLRPKRTLYG